MYCQACNKLIEDDSLFCIYCGAKVPEGANAVPAPSESGKTVFCTKCGASVPADYAFCDRCGNRIAAGPVQKPESAPEPVTAPSWKASEPAVHEVSAPPSQRQSAEEKLNYESAHVSPPVRSASNDALGFLNMDAVLIDEKISGFKFANSYLVYDMNGSNIGAVEQYNISGGAKAARVFLGNSAKGLQQFHYRILDINGKQLAAVHRDGGAFAQIRIVDSADRTVGYLARGKILSPDNGLLCNFKSDWKGWNLTLTAPDGSQIGEVKKKWNGLGKELFTSADKYYVTISPSVTGDTRIAIFGTAIVYDILLHEM